MRGKYSPTVTRAYMKDRYWHSKFMSADGFIYDPEGFDSYGYNEDDIDRAGNHEDDYIRNDNDTWSDEDFNNAYDIAGDDWGFDGTKPALILVDI